MDDVEVRADDELTPIKDVRWRQRVRIEGIVQTLRIRPAAHEAAILECVVDDGDARLPIVFFGHRKIGGLQLGRRVQVEGLVIEWEHRLAILNPIYTLLAPA